MSTNVQIGLTVEELTGLVRESDELISKPYENPSEFETRLARLDSIQRTITAAVVVAVKGGRYGRHTY